ncbi:MAG: RidA family protein [Hyphomicrobiales bacterium]
MHKGFNPSGVWHPRGRGFSMAVAQAEGQVVHFTGQVAWDENENIVGRGDIEAQTRQCFQNTAAILAALGGTLEDLVSVTTYYTDQSQLPAIQKVRSEVFGEGYAPTSTSVMVAGLGHEDFLVELAPVAVIPFSRHEPPAD